MEETIDDPSSENEKRTDKSEESQGSGSLSYPVDAYEPSPEEIAEAESHMSMEQRETSRIRKLMIESEHRILELPDDLVYHNHWYNALGTRAEDISGTFNGRKMEFEVSPATGRLRAKADGKDISDEEARAIWDDIYPVVIAFQASKTGEDNAVKRIRDQIDRENARIEQLKAIESAHEQALIDNEKRDEAGKLLDENIAKMELSDKDRIVVAKIRAKIIDLVTQENPAGSVELIRKRSWDKDGNPTAAEVFEEYNRTLELLFQLLGSDIENAQVWVAGFGVTYIDSKVYDTIFPDIILRESYDTEYQRVGAGAQVYIERNSRYAKTIS